ncbi:Deoxyhypusine synthase [Hondaea fermentalgiana]|uniref:deoxyhypusine synthase n=1 Tax=Hondaea fermentalgiana TaxID=2315210 RepID=A0A2R5G8G8_9STRA|nr:Deoxyhypusine synthase [Hondaea fermentalgiana]|eukprot:GBG24773.1 Deoxyhypusine synthase [Hondaea fermentalgiana]
MSEVPKVAQEAVLVVSEETPDTETVKGYDFNDGVNLEEVLNAYKRVGFQSTNLGLAVEEINKMLKWRLSDEPVKEDDNITDPEERANTKCTIFLSYTSNLISSGIREVLRFLVEHKLVDCIVTTAGGIEEDFIKCLAPTYLGAFDLPGKQLREKGLNRIGNLLVPNDNYRKFDDWLTPILDVMYKEQKEDGITWTPSKMIHRLGKEIDNPESVYYWAYKNDIPVFCPAITDGSIGDMLYFRSYKNEDFVLDIVGDIRAVNDLACKAPKTGMVILGGGLVKHHVCNANLMRNGADFSVFINTASEFDGSDSGARPDEAISWGKIRREATPVKLYCEVTLVFPLIVAQTFAKYYHEQKALKAKQDEETQK